MSQKHLRLTAHKINDYAWWYEENGGISLVVKGRIVVIPWKSIRAALARKDKR